MAKLGLMTIFSLYGWTPHLLTSINRFIYKQLWLGKY